MTQAANKWQSKVDALILLAEDQAGKPEGSLAKEKLRRILRRFPELRQHKPLDDFASRVFTVRHLGQMWQQGISTGGSWTGDSLNEAVNMMVADYKRRLWERKTLGLNVDRMKLELIVGKSLLPFVKSLERLANKINELEFPDKLGVFRLCLFRRVSGSIYTSTQYVGLEACAYFTPDADNCARQEVGPGIRVGARALPKGKTRVNMECCHPAFYSAFNKLAFDLSDVDVKIAYLEHELEALEPKMIEEQYA